MFQLELGSLNLETSRELLSSLSPVSLSLHDLKTIASQSLGNPYYLVESLRYYLGQGCSSLPPLSLQASLVARISQRSEVEKRVLDTLAVALTPIGVEALRKTTKYGASEFNLAVERLRAQELVQAEGSMGDRTLRLAHDWVRVTVLSGLGVDEKELIHASIARFTESECSGSPSQWEAVSLARHWLNSGTPHLSKPYLGSAIEALVELPSEGV